MRKQRIEFMDKRNGISHDKLIKYINLILPVVLVTIEILVIAEYFLRYAQGDASLLAGIALICGCLALTVLDVVDVFAVRTFKAKLVIYGFDCVLFLIVCILAGNSYLSYLYCIVLTQTYFACDFKKSCIFFGVSCAIFMGSFICGWVVANSGASIARSFIEVLSGVIFGILIITAHFLITNFIIKFYRTNLQLKAALKIADDGRVRLEEAYDQLSQTAVYEERNRIAKDIHDNAGHSMTTVIMQTEAAKLLIDTNPEEAKKRVISANIQAKNALEQMRASVHLLAGRTEKRTVCDEISEIAAQTMDGTNIKVRCDLSEVELDEKRGRFICNTVKECLSNGVRHGGATAFYIELKNEENSVKLLVSDNGKGLDGQFKDGFGIKSMREGAAVFGGVVQLSSEDGEGLEVSVDLPIAAE